MIKTLGVCLETSEEIIIYGYIIYDINTWLNTLISSFADKEDCQHK